jgi:Zn-dependent protease with chaperone function
VSRVLWLAAVVLGVTALPLLLSGRATRAAGPRLVAAVELLALVGLGLLPPALLACAAGALGAPPGSTGRTATGLCLLASGPLRPAQLALYGLVVVFTVRTGFLAARAMLAARRAELRGVTLQGATPRCLSGGAAVWVVPSDQLVAYSGGLRHPRAVVSTGLLQLLAPAEQEAVLHHEVAHIRLGHPRLFLLGGVVAQSYNWLPPARLAWCRLRRELEAAADDEAAEAVGTGPLICALAKVALARSQPAALAFADPDDLRWRIGRLQERRALNPRSTFTFALVGAVLTATLSWAACETLHSGAHWASLLACLVGFGFLGGRPMWTGARRLLHPAR